MKLKSVVETNRTEEYSWKLCVSVLFVIVLVISDFAFRYKIWHGISAYVRKAALAEWRAVNWSEEIAHTTLFAAHSMSSIAASSNGSWKLYARQAAV